MISEPLGRDGSSKAAVVERTAESRDAAGRLLPGNAVGRSTRFQKGQSGNPRGRPVQAREVRQHAQEHSIEAIDRLVELMRSRDEQVAVSACRALLDRAVGKPEQAVHVDATRTVTAEEVTADPAAVYEAMMNGTAELALPAPEAADALPSPDPIVGQEPGLETSSKEG